MEYFTNYHNEHAYPALNNVVSQLAANGLTSDDVFGCYSKSINQMCRTTANGENLENSSNFSSPCINPYTQITNCNSWNQNYQTQFGSNQESTSCNKDAVEYAELQELYKQSSYTWLANSYCWCSFNDANANYCSGASNFGYQTAFSTCADIDGHKDSSLQFDKKMSKSDINLKLLREFEYETVLRNVDGEDKPQTIYICKFDNCNKEFTRTWNILDHARMHKGVKPFSCDFCLKQFTQKGNLRKHLKIHLIPSINQRKRYKCEYCDSSYTERYNYKTHIKKHNLAHISN